MYDLKDRTRIREIISSKRCKRVTCANAKLEPLYYSVPKSSKIEFYIAPGKATAEEIGELFSELSILYQMMGGTGINFNVVEAKEPVFTHVLES